MLINDNLKKAYLPLTLSANGTIGSAATTVDIASSFNIVASAANLNFTLPTPTDPLYGDIVEVGGASTNVNSFTINTQKIAATGEFAYIRWNGVNWQILNPNAFSGNVVAMTPFNSGVETVIAFDGLEMKWHQSGSSFDGIAIRTQVGTRSLRYSDTEWYIANAAADGGKSTWGSNNAWYNLPILGATATIINTVYPYAQNVTTTFLGMGNPALPNADMRLYFLFDDTNKVTYKIFVDKQGSTGEITTAQTGTCMIVVEKLGVTTNQIITASNGLVMSGSDVRLGTNPLTQNTDIPQAGFNLSTSGTGNFGIGISAPTAKLHVDGTLTTGQVGATIANQAVNFTLSNAQIEASSVIKIAQTTANIQLTSIAAPTSVATGRFLRVHNTGTVDIVGAFPIQAGRFLDLQWSGTAWALQTVPASSVNIPIIQQFTASGTYTPTAGVKYIIVKMVGGGGAGGGASAFTGTTSVGVGGGGGAGGYIEAQLTAAQIGASQPITIGTGGVAISGTTGGNGGNTTFGTLLTANGGSGGATVGAAGNFGTSFINGGIGGLATVSTGIDLMSRRGDNGGTGTALAITAQGIYSYASGMGASTPFGAGQPIIRISTIISATSSVAGVSAGAFTGTGGSGGGNGGTNPTAVAGGNGGSGVVRITEYF